MGTTVTPLAGNAVWPIVGEAVGAEGFLGILGEVAAGAAGAVAGIVISPSPAGGEPRRGQVADHPNLTFGYHPDELAVTISRTGADGTAQPVSRLMRDGTGALHDANGSRAGQILSDGTVSLDPSWLQAHGVASAGGPPAPQGATKVHSAEDPTDSDRSAQAPDEQATRETSPTEGLQESNRPKARVSPERRTHIVDGDDTGGGHRYGTGRGKTEFPPDWSDDKIIGELESVANDPASNRSLQPNGRTRVEGTRDGVDIRVIVDPDGTSIRTGHPINR